MTYSTSIWNIIAIRGETMQQAITRWWAHGQPPQQALLQQPTHNQQNQQPPGGLAGSAASGEVESKAQRLRQPNGSPPPLPCNPKTTPSEICGGGAECPQCGKATCFCPAPVSPTNASFFTTDCIWTKPQFCNPVCNGFPFY